jgi:hypothetical protein
MGIMQDSSVNTQEEYFTWQTFKRDIELSLGHYVSINLWLQAKPKKPFPWSPSDMNESIQYIAKAERELFI